MQNLPVNPKLLLNTSNFTFISVPSIYEGFTDVYYNGQRVAIINGLSSPLQWTAKNGSNIPNNVIDELECLVSSLINYQ